MDDDQNYEREEWVDFRDEIKKIQRGVKVMWFVNFIFLSLVFNAIMIIFFVEFDASTPQLLSTVALTTGASLVIAAIVMFIVIKNSRKFIASGLGSSATEVFDGPLYDAVEEVSIAAGMKQNPQVFISEDNVMNAYALGDANGNYYVAATRPLMETLGRDELTAVMAHEIAHIESGDSVDMQKLIALSSMIGLVSAIGTRMMFYSGGGRGGNNNNGANPIAIALIIASILFLILAPVFQQMGNAFMSRQRETRADRLAVKYTRDPTALATALMKINNTTAEAVESSSQTKEDVKKFNNTIGALAFYKPSFIGKSFSTHPPFEERIESLSRMGAQIEE